MEITTHALDEIISQTQLEELDLSSDLIKSLVEKGYKTIGHVYELQAEGIALILNIDFTTAQIFWDGVLQFISNPNRWAQEPAEIPPEIPAQKILSLPKLIGAAIEDCFTFENRARQHEILMRRFGLKGSKEYTLEDIGIFFNLSRERVRQLEAKALKFLKIALLEKPQSVLIGEPFPTTVELVEEIQTVKQHLGQKGGPILTEREIFDFLAARYGIELDTDQQAQLRLLFVIYGWKRITSISTISLTIHPSWLVRSHELDLDRLWDVLHKAGKFLVETCVGMSYFDLKVSINRHTKRSDNSDLLLTIGAS